MSALRCYFVLLCSFVGLCSALVCNVTQVDDQTTYSISDAMASDCEYTWTNATRHVLAHNLDQTPELVKRNNINILVTSRCLNEIFNTRICHSEGERYTINCTIKCRAWFHKDKEISHIWIAVIVAIVILALVMLGCLCYKLRDEIRRIRSCNQLRCIYTAVNKNVEPQPDVEAAKE